MATAERAIAAATAAALRRRGYHLIHCEAWRPYAPGQYRKTDLAGMFDLLALKPGRLVGIQRTSLTNLAAHRHKITASPAALPWLRAGGSIELWAWVKPRGRWRLYRQWAELHENRLRWLPTKRADALEPLI